MSQIGPRGDKNCTGVDITLTEMLFQNIFITFVAEIYQVVQGNWNAMIQWVSAFCGFSI